MRNETQAAIQQWLEGETIQFRSRDNSSPRTWTELLPADNSYCNNIQFYDSNEYRVKPQDIVLYRLSYIRGRLGYSDTTDISTHSVYRSMDQIEHDMKYFANLKDKWIYQSLEEIIFDRDTLKLISCKLLPRPNL